MTALHGIWRTLDLAPTGDTSAIRKAYARALKTFDMDEEPARYIALREARDAAIAQAPYFDADATLEEGEDDEADWATAEATSDAVVDAADWDDRWSLDFEDERWQPAMPASPPASATPPHDDAATAHEATMREHYDAVLAMLFPGDEREGQPLDHIAAAVLVERVQALLADPRMEELAFHTEAERWFAEIIAGSPVRSDPILTLAIGHFNWLASRGRIDQSLEAAAVVARYDALLFVTELQDHKHPLHKAWHELRKPATERSRKTFGVGGSKVRRLISEIRTHHPMLEPQLDGYRVSLWEKPPRLPTDWRTWWGIIALIFLVVRIFLAAGDDTPRASIAPPVAPSYASAEQVLDPMLATLGGPALTMATIREKNPRLHGQLQTNWALARENGTDRITFSGQLSELLIDRYNAGARRAPHALLVELFTLRLDKARLVRGHGWQACSDFFTDGSAPAAWLSPKITERGRALIARVLLETDGDPLSDKTSNMFTVPGAVVDKASKRAGMPRADFVRGMANQGSAEERCRSAIALGETALTLPAKQADPILRSL